MFLSMHNWMRAEPIELTIRRLARYGYDSIEISGEPEKYDTTEVRRLLQENGVRCWGSVTLMFAGRDLTNATFAEARASLYLVNSDGSNLQQLIPQTYGSINALAWRPDGKVLAYLADNVLWRLSAGGRPQVITRGLSADPNGCTEYDNMANYRLTVYDGSKWNVLQTPGYAGPRLPGTVMS